MKRLIIDFPDWVDGIEFQILSEEVEKNPELPLINGMISDLQKVEHFYIDDEGALAGFDLPDAEQERILQVLENDRIYD